MDTELEKPHFIDQFEADEAEAGEAEEEAEKEESGIIVLPKNEVTQCFEIREPWMPAQLGLWSSTKACSGN